MRGPSCVSWQWLHHGRKGGVIALDYYETLGISASAPDSEVKKAYRRLAMIYHPDRNPHASAEIKFKEIREAYEVLSDREGRERYDRSRFDLRQAEDDNDDVDAWASDGRADAEHTNVGRTARGGAKSSLWILFGVLVIGTLILAEIRKEQDSESLSATSKEAADSGAQRTVDETAGIRNAPNREAPATTDSPGAPMAASSPPPISSELSPPPVAARARPAQQRLPDLSRASRSERSVIEDACSYERRSDGPASYYACLRSEAEALGRSSGPPDLSRASRTERSMIEGACSYEKRSDGPASYYACLRSEAEALGRSSGPPDLSRASRTERSMIEGACSYEKRSDGPASYYACLRSEAEALGRSSGPPDLSRASRAERSMIEGACSYEKRSDGPASYYACLRSEAEALGRSSGPPDLSRASRTERSMIEGACSYEKRSDGPASYYACLRSEVEALGRSSGPPDLIRASPSSVR